MQVLHFHFQQQSQNLVFMLPLIIILNSYSFSYKVHKNNIAQDSNNDLHQIHMYQYRKWHQQYLKPRHLKLRTFDYIIMIIIINSINFISNASIQVYDFHQFGDLYILNHLLLEMFISYSKQCKFLLHLQLILMFLKSFLYPKFNRNSTQQ